MSSPVSDPSVYTDVNGLAALKRGAKAQDPNALREAARQFESLFTKMMLKSMREASFGDPVFGSDQQKFYQGMFDDQLAVDLTKGHGLGLADMLIQQLTRTGLIPADAAKAGSAATGSNAPGGNAVTAKGGAARAGENGLVVTPIGTTVNGAPGYGNVSGGSNATLPGYGVLLGNGRPGGSSLNAFGNGVASDAGSAGTNVGAAGTGAAGAAGSTVGSCGGPVSAPGTAPTNGAPVSSAVPSGAPATTPDTTARTTRTLTPEEFVQQMWPSAEAAGQVLGIDPRNLVAQAALETGWGRSIPRDASGNSSFNLFGVKTGTQWSGSTVAVRTIEFEAGVPVPRTDKFRAYDSADHSFNDYVSLLSNNPRYAAALNTGNDTQAFASALQKGGYATDPAYAQKLVAIAQNVDGMKTALKSADPRPINPTSMML